MAKKGTYGALKTQAGQVDYGEAAKETAKEIAGTIESNKKTLLAEESLKLQNKLAQGKSERSLKKQELLIAKEKRLAIKDKDSKRSNQLKMELAKSNLELSQKKYALQLRKESDGLEDRFRELSKDMVNTDTSGLLNPILTEVLKNSTNNVANMQRELMTADSDKRAEINIKLDRYSSNAKNLKSMALGFNNFLTEYNTVVNGKKKYSDFNSARPMIMVLEAIKSAANEGLTKNKDGTYNWGSKVVVYGMGTPDMKLGIKGDDGKEKYKRSIESITSVLSAELKPYNDFAGMTNEIIKGVKLSMKTSRTKDGAMIVSKTEVDVPRSKDSIKVWVNNQLGDDDSDRMKELINKGTFGDTPDEIRKKWVEDIFKAKEIIETEKLSKDPEYQAEVKEKNDENASLEITKAISGDTNANTNLEGMKWKGVITGTDEDKNDVEITDGVIKKTQRVGNFYVVEVVGKGGINATKTYPLDTESSRKQVGMFLAEAYQGVPGRTKFNTTKAQAAVDYSNIPIIEGERGKNITNALNAVATKLAPLKQMSGDPDDKKVEAAIKTIKDIGTTIGIKIKVNMGTWATNNVIKITETDGTVTKVREGNHKEAIDAFMNEITRIFDKVTPQVEATTPPTSTSATPPTDIQKIIEGF